MNLIRLDTTNAISHDLIEEVVLGLMLAFKHEGDVVSWRNELENISVAVTSGCEFVRISVGGDQNQRSRTIKKLGKLICAPRERFLRESSIDKDYYIEYLEWGRSAFREFENTIAN